MTSFQTRIFETRRNRILWKRLRNLTDNFQTSFKNLFRQLWMQLWWQEINNKNPMAKYLIIFNNKVTEHS